MQYFRIKRFNGVATRIESTDQDRGTLRRCEGAIIAPNGAISSPPCFSPLWGIDDIDSLIESYWTNETDGFGYFLKLAHGGNILLVFYEKAYGVRGLWWVKQNASGITEDEVTPTVTAAYTSGLDISDKDKVYYGSWINGNLWLGHGELLNLVYRTSSDTITALGATAPTDPYDIGKDQFPPVKSFIQNAGGAIFGAGHTAGTYPATRVWMTDMPNKEFPKPERIANIDNSYVDILRSDASEVTALSIWQEYIVAHTDSRPWIITRLGSGNDGWHAEQVPTPIAVSAPNHNAARDLSGIGRNWLGADGEIYEDHIFRASTPDKNFDRDRDIASNRADNVWNELIDRSGQGAHTIFDRVNSRFFAWAPLKGGVVGSFGLFVWDEKNRSIAGSMLYPSAIASTMGRNTNDGLNVAIVVDANGSLLFTNLDDLREREEWETEDFDAPDDGVFEASEVVIPSPPDAMVVEGPAGSPEVLGLYLRDGDFGGMPKYAIPSADPVFTIFEEFAIWRIDLIAGGWPLSFDFYIGPENVATPDLVSEWEVRGAGFPPVPTVRRATWDDFGGFPIDIPTTWLQGQPDRDKGGILYQIDSDRVGTFQRFAKTAIGADIPEPIESPEGAKTMQWKGATVARIEISPRDLGDPVSEKVFQEIRLTWQRGSKCYVGVFVRTDYGQKDGYWVGNPWPSEEQFIGINLRGRRIYVTIMAVFSSKESARAMLRDMTIGFLPSGTAHGI